MKKIPIGPGEKVPARLQRYAKNIPKTQSQTVPFSLEGVVRLPSSTSCRLQAILNVHDLTDTLLDSLGLIGRETLERSSGVATVAVVALDGRLGAGDGGLGQDPIALGEGLLESLSLVLLALDVEVPDADARLGHDVGTAGDDTAAAADEGLDGEVGDAAKGEVAGTLLEGGLCVGDIGDAGELAGAAAGELGSDDVGVLGQLDEEIAVHVDTGDGTGVVVDDDGDGAGVGEVDKVVVDGLLVDLGTVVGGRENKSADSTGLGGQLAQLNGAADTTLGGTQDDGHVLEASLVEGLSGSLGDGKLLLAGAVNSLAVGTHGDETGETGAGQSLSMLLDRGDIKVLSLGVEECHDGGVDAGRERSRSGILSIMAICAVGDSVGGGHDGGCFGGGSGGIGLFVKGGGGETDYQEVGWREGRETGWERARGGRRNDSMHKRSEGSL